MNIQARLKQAEERAMLLEYCEECLRIFFLRDYLMILKMITN